MKSGLSLNLNWLSLLSHSLSPPFMSIPSLLLLSAPFSFFPFLIRCSLLRFSDFFHYILFQIFLYLSFSASGYDISSIPLSFFVFISLHLFSSFKYYLFSSFYLFFSYFFLTFYYFFYFIYFTFVSLQFFSFFSPLCLFFFTLPFTLSFYSPFFFYFPSLFHPFPSLSIIFSFPSHFPPSPPSVFPSSFCVKALFSLPKAIFFFPSFAVTLLFSCSSSFGFSMFTCFFYFTFDSFFIFSNSVHPLLLLVNAFFYLYFYYSLAFSLLTSFFSSFFSLSPFALRFLLHIFLVSSFFLKCSRLPPLLSASFCFPFTLQFGNWVGKV